MLIISITNYYVCKERYKNIQEKNNNILVCFNILCTFQENCLNSEVVDQIYKRNPILRYTHHPLHAPLLPLPYGDVHRSCECLTPHKCPSPLETSTRLIFDLFLFLSWKGAELQHFAGWSTEALLHASAAWGRGWSCPNHPRPSTNRPWSPTPARWTLLSSH